MIRNKNENAIMINKFITHVIKITTTKITTHLRPFFHFDKDNNETSNACTKGQQHTDSMKLK